MSVLILFHGWIIFHCVEIPSTTGKFLKIFLKDFIHLLLERRREGEREEGKHQCVVASCVPPSTQPATQACALNWDSNQRPLARRPAFDPLSLTSQACNWRLDPWPTSPHFPHPACSFWRPLISILCLESLAGLEFTSKRGHALFPWLIWHNALKVYPCCYRWPVFLLFVAGQYSIVHICYVVFVHSSSDRPFGSVHVFNYGKSRCSEHGGT